MWEFELDDLDTQSLVSEISKSKGRQTVVLGLHISTLNALFRKQIRSGDFHAVDFIYCDGWSMWLLGKIAGLKHIERVATTDLYPFVVNHNQESLNVVFIGGSSDLQDKILLKWKAIRPFDKGHSFHGYQPNWKLTLEKVNLLRPDFIFLGLGMPKELLFINQYRDLLPDSTIITCGGMLRIIAEVEKRSPKFIQNWKLEWLYRMITSPRRTFLRYTIGFFNFLRASFAILSKRFRSLR